MYTYTYQADGGKKLENITAPDGGRMYFEYDGSLPIKTEWAGEISGSITRTYNNDFRLVRYELNDGFSYDFQYDPDGLLIQTGDFQMTRNPANGMVMSMEIGNLYEERVYNSLGEVVAEGNPSAITVDIDPDVPVEPGLLKITGAFPGAAYVSVNDTTIEADTYGSVDGTIVLNEGYSQEIRVKAYNKSGIMIAEDSALIDVRSTARPPSLRAVAPNGDMYSLTEEKQLARWPSVGSQWEYPLADDPDQTSINLVACDSQGRVFFTDYNNNISMLVDDDRQIVLESANLPISYIGSMAFGPDGHLCISSPWDTGIYRVNEDYSVSEIGRYSGSVSESYLISSANGLVFYINLFYPNEKRCFTVSA